LLTLPFGAVGSVLAWYRTAHALRCIMRRVFELVLFVYVDDTHQIEVESTAESGKALFCEVMKLLGWTLDDKKSQGMASKVTSLGCVLRINPSGCQWTLCSVKRGKWCHELEDCLRPSLCLQRLQAACTAVYNLEESVCSGV